MQGKCSGPECAETFQRSNLTGSNSTVRRGVSVAGVYPPILLCAKHIMHLLSAAVRAQERYCKPRPGLLPVAAFREERNALALNISATTVLLPDLPIKTLYARPNESTGRFPSILLLSRSGESLHHDPNCNVSSSGFRGMTFDRAAALVP